MREYMCVICGEKGIDKSAEGNRKYCSKECANMARYHKRRGIVENECKYNSGVTCANEKCDKCGWNPAVEELRKAKQGGSV